jgi:allophanate hydrolase
MRSHGATFLRSDRTAKIYRLLCLNTTPKKPGLIPAKDGGRIYVEIWEMPVKRLGEFVRSIPPPLGVGQIELDGGEQVTGFIFDQSPEIACQDITDYGGWPDYRLSLDQTGAPSTDNPCHSGTNDPCHSGLVPESKSLEQSDARRVERR